MQVLYDSPTDDRVFPFSASYTIKLMYTVRCCLLQKFYHEDFSEKCFKGAVARRAEVYTTRTHVMEFNFRQKIAQCFTRERIKRVYTHYTE